MSTTPAAHLAHLRDVFGQRWRIEKSDPGEGHTCCYIASERSTGRRIVETSLAQLEHRLQLSASRDE